MSQQLGVLLNAGLPLTDALHTLQKGQTHKALYALLQSIIETLKAGHPLYSILKKYPLFFNDLFCNIVRLGEQSGELGRILILLAQYRVQIETIQKKIKKALVYPLIVLCIAGFVTTSLLIFVVPQFESLFKSFNADLPFFTKSIILISNSVKNYGLYTALIITILLYALRYAYRHSTTLTFYIDRYLLMLPYFGNALKKASIARFSKTLSIALSAGLPLTEALSAISETTGNKVYHNGIIVIIENVLRGISLHTAMEQCNLFPNSLTQMIAIGESSGSVEHMLNQISEDYHQMLNDTANTLGQLLEPLLMVVLGVLVGGLIIAMYLPIFQLGAIVS